MLHHVATNSPLEAGSDDLQFGSFDVWIICSSHEAGQFSSGPRFPVLHGQMVLIDPPNPFQTSLKRDSA